MSKPRNWGVLVTGAGGTVGLNLVSSLAGSCRLRCLVRRAGPFREALAATGTAPEELEVVEADVRDSSAVRRACDGVDAVVHLAALTSDENPNQFELLKTNLLGTQAVLEGAARAGASRVILASTYHVYGRLRALPPGPVGEETPLNPASPYAASKAVAESMARGAGVGEVILRLPHLYGAGVGAGDWGGVLLKFVDQALQDSVIPLEAAAASDLRDYLHIRDAVACLRNLTLARDPVRGTFNVGSGRSVTLEEAAQQIAQEIGRVKGRPVQVRVSAQIPTPQERAFLDVGKIRREHGFAAQVDFRQGIVELLGRLVPA